MDLPAPPDLSSNILVQAGKKQAPHGQASVVDYQANPGNRAARVVEAPPRDPQGKALVDEDGRHQPGATKGLKLFAVKLPDVPLTRIWAKDEEDAWRRFKKEWGIIKTEHDWQVEPIPA